MISSLLVSRLLFQATTTASSSSNTHFYNLDTTDSHTFTIGAPYNIDKVVTPGQNATFTFKGADQGIYRFYCRFHQPTMTGQLVVLAPPIVEKPTTTDANTTR